MISPWMRNLGLSLGNNVTRLVLGISAIALMPSVFPQPARAANPPIQALHQELELAVCLNEWPYALSVIDPLIAASELSPRDRSDLAEFRHQLEHYAAIRAVIPQSPACEAVLARTISADRVFSTDPPLDWAGSLYALTNSGNPRPASLRQSNQYRPVLQFAFDDANTPIPLLSPATLVDLSNGSNVVSGAVSTGYQVFSFLAGLGDHVSLDVDVTEILPGVLYTDDDSQLFLFDRNGQLLAENDDLSGLQSGIQDFLIPETGYYYVVVTTYNNDPILNAEHIISGWSDNGGSNIEYTLTIYGVTPTAQLLRPALSEQ